MASIGLDLGTTNIKAALYDDSLQRTAILSKQVAYLGDKTKVVEFDADAYFMDVINLLKQLNEYERPVERITLTGQAESLIFLDDNCRSVRNGISWMDERAIDECAELAKLFSEKEIYSVTGQKSIIPTWPATKILNLNKHEPEAIKRTRYYVLLKDYIAYRLTGVLAGDKSISTFSLYVDIHKQSYWNKMLSQCGLKSDNLPELVEPGTELGKILPNFSLGVNFSDTLINIGTLDHFAGMIGTGNIEPGVISESTGTVLGISTLANSPLVNNENAPLHIGPFPGSYVLMQVAESGGISLEWFRNTFLKEHSFTDINTEIQKRTRPSGLLFLPYIIGVNAPEFDADACGVFYGIKAGHDVFDFACAVMEGIAFLLERNIRSLSESGKDFKKIISTGGGAKSDLWSQIKADVTGLAVEIPKDNEAACLGAAIMGAVSAGVFDDYTSAASSCVRIHKKFTPSQNSEYRKKKSGFETLYDGMIRTAMVLST